MAIINTCMKKLTFLKRLIDSIQISNIILAIYMLIYFLIILLMFARFVNSNVPEPSCSYEEYNILKTALLITNK